MIEIRITGHIELTRQFDEEEEALSFLQEIRDKQDALVEQRTNMWNDKVLRPDNYPSYDPWPHLSRSSAAYATFMRKVSTVFPLKIEIIDSAYYEDIL